MPAAAQVRRIARGHHGATEFAGIADLGVDEISFNTGTDDIDDIKRLADIVF